MGLVAIMFIETAPCTWFSHDRYARRASGLLRNANPSLSAIAFSLDVPGGTISSASPKNGR